MLIVNLFGAPGAGKSTGAAYIFSMLKMRNINADLVTEFAKEKLYEETKKPFRNQAYMFGNQYFRLSAMEGKADVAITDSPLLIYLYYNKGGALGEEFSAMVDKVFKSYDSLNYFVLRDFPYNPQGRFQTEQESDAMIEPMRALLREHDVEYKTIKGSIDGYDTVIEDVFAKMAGDI